MTLINQVIGYTQVITLDQPTNPRVRHPQQWVMTQLWMNHNLSYEGSKFQPILIVKTYHVNPLTSSPPAT
jgi:hypothetical protein